MTERYYVTYRPLCVEKNCNADITDSDPQPGSRKAYCRMKLGTFTDKEKIHFEEESKIQINPDFDLQSWKELGLAKTPDPADKHAAEVYRRKTYAHKTLMDKYAKEIREKKDRDYLSILKTYQIIADRLERTRARVSALLSTKVASDSHAPNLPPETKERHAPLKPPADNESHKSSKKVKKSRLSSDEIKKRVFAACIQLTKNPDLKLRDLEKIHGLAPKTLSKEPHKDMLKKARP